MFFSLSSQILNALHFSPSAAWIMLLNAVVWDLPAGVLIDRALQEVLECCDLPGVTRLALICAFTLHVFRTYPMSLYSVMSTVMYALP